MLYFNVTGWILQALFFQITGMSLIKRTNKCFCSALKHAVAAAVFRCQLSFHSKLLLILVSHLNGVDRPTVTFLRFDLYFQRATGFAMQGGVTLVLLR